MYGDFERTTTLIYVELSFCFFSRTAVTAKTGDGTSRTHIFHRLLDKATLQVRQSF